MDISAFLNSMQKIVGRRYVLTSDRQTRHFLRGFRSGSGQAIAVVRPGSLVELWRVLKLAVAENIVVILQAANTGLTGGSTPAEGYDRQVLVISVLRLDALLRVPDTQQIIAFPGSTLFDLEVMLEAEGRTPHSVIGSSCIGASIVGGICNNSGGALIQRGPAYTELALYARVTEEGTLELVNELGVALSDDPETALTQLEGRAEDLNFVSNPEAWGSDREYQDWVRKVGEPTPARFNADARRLSGVSGCAGKLAVFAVRVDSFEKPKEEQTFFLAADHPGELGKVRQDILEHFENLPVSGEYMHENAVRIAEAYGRDTVYILSLLGTRFLPTLFKIKSWFDGVSERLGFGNIKPLDHILQLGFKLAPRPALKRLRDFMQYRRHFLILKMSNEGVSEARQYLKKYAAHSTDLSYLECSAQEANRLFQLRFAVASAAIRYEAIHYKETEDILALDIALRRDDDNWFETLPAALEESILEKIYYGHFFCHVFHQDYLIKKGRDIEVIKKEMLKILDGRGAEYPAEHNVGHSYIAKPALADHYKKIDPTNSLNPGIGMLSKNKNYRH